MEGIKNRATFQRLAETRLKDAEVLYENGQYAGAYYLAGYAIECALKACIAKKTKEFDFPPQKKIIDKIYTHDLSKLLSVTDMNIDSAVEVNWALILKWNESIRYEEPEENVSKEVYEAISDPNEGVFQWIKQYW